MLISEDPKKDFEFPKVNALVTGNPGSGKTRFSATFPKIFYISFGAREKDTFVYDPELRKNFVRIHTLVPESKEEQAELFGKDYKNGVETEGTFFKLLAEAKEMWKKGEVETLVIDPLTYLQGYLWDYIETYCVKYTRSGAIDTQSMYGDLNSRGTKLVQTKISTFPGNIIVTTHEKKETEEILSKLSPTANDIVPDVIGGLRNKLGGMFSNVLYLEKVDKVKTVNNVQVRTYTYFARTNVGNSKNAKSRLNLPPVIEDISYTKIMQTINEAIKTNDKEVK